MDNGGTHIFGKSPVDDNTIFKLVATTLEIADIRVTFKNFTKGAKRLADVETALIGIAQDLKISVDDYRRATAKVIEARDLQKKKTKPKLKVAEEEPDETPSEDLDTEIKEQ